MDSTAPPAPDPASRARAAVRVGSSGGAGLGAPLGHPVRESALLLSLTLVVLGVAAAPASTTLLLG